MFEKKDAKQYEIYLDIINASHLNDSHKQSLKTDRGFDDHTIRVLKFRSCGEYMKQVIASLKEKYTLSSLHKAGIIHSAEKDVLHFYDPNKIIIPYLDASGQIIYYLKCHKQGNLPNTGLEPYCHYLVSAPHHGTSFVNNYIVFCESEFKAIALWQLGFRAIGLNGINAFSGEHIDKLNQFINEKSHIIIAFDNAIQNDPSFPESFKNSTKKRHAHIIWSYKMAKRIESRFAISQDGTTGGITIKPMVRIATLPKDWIGEDGKIDCDTALARGKGLEHFQMVLADAMEPETYRQIVEIPDEDKPYVYRKFEQEVRSIICYERANKYWTQTPMKDGGFKETRLSNFVLRHKNSIYKDGELYREMYLKNDLMDISETFILSAKECSDYRLFKAKCMSRGDFMWLGTDKQFNYVIENIFLDHDSNPIHILDYCGRNESIKAWVYGNMIIKDDGTVIDPSKSEDGRTFVDKNRSYRVLPLKSGGSIPKLSSEPIDLAQVIYHIDKAWGYKGVHGLAFVISTLFSNAIFDITQAFPLLMVYGEREAGKSALTDVLVSMVGFGKETSAQNITDTTNVALGRIMNYYSSLPVRFDEFRNDDQKTQIKTSLLRSLYNRQAASKGLRDNFGVREVTIRGTFILTGEDYPDDPALFSRCIPLHIKGYKTKQSAESMKWLYDMGNKLSYLTYYILTNYNRLKEKFISDFKSTLEGLKQDARKTNKYNPRAMNHYAMQISALGNVFGFDIVKEYQKEMLLNFSENIEQQNTESAAYRFFSDIFAMRYMSQPVMKYVNKPSMCEDWGVFQLKMLHDLWSKYKSQHGGIKSLMSMRVIKEYLKSKPYILGSVTAKSEAVTNYTDGFYVVDLTHPDCPSDLKNLFNDFEGSLSTVIEDHDEQYRIEQSLYSKNSKGDSTPF